MVLSSRQPVNPQSGLTIAPRPVVLHVVGGGVQEVPQVEVVVVVVREALVHTKVQLSVGGAQEQPAPHQVVAELPQVLQSVWIAQ